jgi:hypothetical protein
MKNLIVLALFLALGATAQAKYAPVDAQAARILPDDLAIATGAGGATREQNYFRAPQPADATGRIFLCRPQRLIFDKTRLAQSCD